MFLEIGGFNGPIKVPHWRLEVIKRLKESKTALISSPVEIDKAAHRDAFYALVC